MTKKETEYLWLVFNKIKDPDARIQKAITIVEKQLKTFDTYKGQMKDMYDYDRGPW